jgi:hypothetical protein
MCFRVFHWPKMMSLLNIESITNEKKNKLSNRCFLQSVFIPLNVKLHREKYLVVIPVYLSPKISKLIQELGGKVIQFFSLYLHIDYFFQCRISLFVYANFVTNVANLVEI